MGLTALKDIISVYIKLSPRVKRYDWGVRTVKTSKQLPATPAAGGVDPCLAIIEVGRKLPLKFTQHHCQTKTIPKNLDQTILQQSIYHVV